MRDSIEIIVTKEFEDRYLDLPLSLQKKAEKQEALFRSNPFYPSLHTEKLEPKEKEIWSFRIDRNYRILFRFLSGNQVILLTLGTHDWIYKIIERL